MDKNKKFNTVITKHLKTLTQYVPIVARVHGKSHPEFIKLQKVFDSFASKITEYDPDMPELNDEFMKMREITNNYTVPEDVCESYEAVYTMLAELDKAYYS